MTLLTVVEYDFLTSLGWDPVRRTEIGWPSILALAETGWLLTAALVSCGLLGVGLAVGLYRSTTGAAAARIAALLVGMLAVAVGLEAFTTDPPAPPGGATWHGDIHDLAYPLVVVLAVVAPVAVGRALRTEPSWRGYGSYSLVTAAILVATLALQAQERFGQLLEYVFFALLLLWLEVIALRLWFVSSRRGRAGGATRLWRTVGAAAVVVAGGAATAYASHTATRGRDPPPPVAEGERRRAAAAAAEFARSCRPPCRVHSVEPVARGVWRVRLNFADGYCILLHLDEFRRTSGGTHAGWDETGCTATP